MSKNLSSERLNFEILPGILEKDWDGIQRKIEIVKPFAKAIHIDILDGKFASNTTFLDPEPFKKYSQDIFFELHMMVEEPLQYLKPFADAGFKRFLGHVEKMSDQAEFVAQGQLLGEVGLAIDGDTSLDAIGVPIDDLDCLLFMSIKAGFSGQKFTQEYARKIEVLKDTTWIPIEVDGGVNDTTILQARDFGATRFVSTSFLFNAENPKSQFDILHQKLLRSS